MVCLSLFGLQELLLEPQLLSLFVSGYGEIGELVLQLSNPNR